MSRILTTNYQADPDTQFQWATDDNDGFDRELDISFLARALERHTHAPGRGVLIPTAGIQDGAITAAKIAPGAVGTTQIAADSITADKIPAGAIGASEITDGAVGTAELADSAVTNAKMAGNSVSTPQVVDHSLTAIKLDALDVPAEKDLFTFDIATGRSKWMTLAEHAAAVPITNAGLAANSVSTPQVVAASLTLPKLHAIDAPADNEIFTYDSGTGFAEWQGVLALIAAAGGITNTQMAAGAAVANLGYTPARSAAGSFLGNGAASRQIAVGFACKFVLFAGPQPATPGYPVVGGLLFSTTTGNNLRFSANATTSVLSGQFGGFSPTALHGSDGFIVDGVGLDGTNISGWTYFYIAIG